MTSSIDTGMLGDFPQSPGVMGSGTAFHVAFAIIVSMIVLVGIVYLIGKAFSNRKLEDWAKNEILQVFVSAALVGGIFLLMAPGTGLITMAFNSLVPAEGFQIVQGTPVSDCTTAGFDRGTALCYAHGYLDYLSLQIVDIILRLFNINVLLDILAKVSINVIVVEITPLSGLSSFVQVFNSMLQSLIFLGVVVEAEKALMIFVNSTALQLFLPIGVVLRSFFGTRKLGGALIALAVGMYLIFPLAISMNGIAVKEATETAFNKTIENLTGLQTKTASLDPMNEMTESGDILSTDAWTAPLGKFQGAVAGLMDSLSAIPRLMITLLSLMVVQVVFLPILSVLLTVIAIKELAALFGSEVNLSRFEV